MQVINLWLLGAESIIEHYTENSLTFVFPRSAIFTVWILMYMIQVFL